MDLYNDSIKFIKDNKKQLISKFVSDCEGGFSIPSTFFMAGVPGAGKTEFSKRLIKKIVHYFVRIDIDEIRDFIPMYNGNNSDRVQAAAAIGVEKIYDYVLKYRYNVLLDGTFMDYDKSRSNVFRAIKRKRNNGIIFVYQDPIIAWDFTKKREKIEGRYVPKNIFINAYFNSLENVRKVKEEFKEKIEIHLIIKNSLNDIKKYYINIDNIDNYIKLNYNRDELNEKII